MTLAQLKDFPKHLKRLLPWLRECVHFVHAMYAHGVDLITACCSRYIVEREAEWAALPRGQGSWDTQDSSLSARSTQYNLLDSGATSHECLSPPTLWHSIHLGNTSAPNLWLLAASVRAGLCQVNRLAAQAAQSSSRSGWG